MTPASALLLPHALPLIPDGDEAREWAERELADPAYTVAEPTPFDRAARGVAEFLASLFSGTLPPELGPWLAVGVLVILAALVGIAFAIWGRPRRTVRSRGAAVDLFGEPEERSAAELRREAEQATRRGDWDTATTLRFRALARGLAERTVVEPHPGATVHAFARSAARAFPAEASALDSAADAFDDVRYLRRPATEAVYEHVAGLDARLSDTVPHLDPAVPA